MAQSFENVLQMIKENSVEFVDLRFVDSCGTDRHVSLPAHTATESLFTDGKPFDGSSISGWQEINESDMLLMPDPKSAVLDPFCEKATLLLRCDIVDPETMTGYRKDPRSIAKNAEMYLKSTGIADVCYLGPEPEFFIFDDVRWENGMSGSFYKIDSEEAGWNTHKEYESGNAGHRPCTKGGYFAVSPVDSSQDLRSEICTILEDMGIPVEAHHHEVATANQNEVATQFNSLVRKADEILLLKYVVHNTARAFGKTATFMAKPLVGDNGSGMHCNMSLFKGDKNIFVGNKYSGLSDEALYFIGGVIHHARAVNAFTNPGTNSYRRLIPGFEAPVMLAYSARNRSAAIRVPYASNPKARRVEVRFPDPTANPYLAFSALLMAGLDGIRNKIHPGDAMDKNLYDLPPEIAKDIPTVCDSLEQALNALDKDRAFLLEGDVFTNHTIDSYLRLKQTEVTRVKMATHPVEFAMYYSA